MRSHAGMLRLAALILAAFAAAPVALAQGTTERYYGYHPMWDGGWWMLLGPVWMILIVAAIVAAIVLTVRWIGGPAPAAPHHPASFRTPVDILKERFARGEIDKAEFEERRKLLE